MEHFHKKERGCKSSTQQQQTKSAEGHKILYCRLGQNAKQWRAVCESLRTQSSSLIYFIWFPWQ